MDEQNNLPAQSIEPVAEVVAPVETPVVESAPVEIVSAPEVATEPQVAEIPTEIPVEISSTPEVGSGQITVIDPTSSNQTLEPRVTSEGNSVEKVEAPVSEIVSQTSASVANLSIEASAPPVSSQKVNPSLLERARLALQLRKQKKILKIMELFTKHETITNDDVEKFLHVSDSTATRYLSQLVKMGKVVQKGKTTMVMYAKQ